MVERLGRVDGPRAYRRSREGNRSAVRGDTGTRREGDEHAWTWWEGDEARRKHRDADDARVGLNIVVILCKVHGRTVGRTVR